jgi:hypothetical protein
MSVGDNSDATRSHFDCENDFSGFPDGKVYICAIGADSAVFDNWTAPNQFADGVHGANFSTPACDDITLDRTAPLVAVAPSASAAVPTAGEAMTFTASASDATSGLDPSTYAWSFSDNTPPVTGNSAPHTFAQAGVFSVTVTVKDNAGNTGSATTTVAVSAPRATPTPTLPPPTTPTPTTPTPTPQPADTPPPNTAITAGPRTSTSRRTARFSFTAIDAASHFQCKLDGQRWQGCRSPKTYRRLQTGGHAFRVRAIDSIGKPDPSPAIRRWRVR